MEPAWNSFIFSNNLHNHILYSGQWGCLMTSQPESMTFQSPLVFWSVSFEFWRVGPVYLKPSIWGLITSVFSLPPGWAEPVAGMAQGEGGLGWVACSHTAPLPSLLPALLLPLQLWLESQRRQKSFYRMRFMRSQSLSWRIICALLTHFFELWICEWWFQNASLTRNSSRLILFCLYDPLWDLLSLFWCVCLFVLKLETVPGKTVAEILIRPLRLSLELTSFHLACFSGTENLKGGSGNTKDKA